MKKMVSAVLSFVSVCSLLLTGCQPTDNRDPNKTEIPAVVAKIGEKGQLSNISSKDGSKVYLSNESEENFSLVLDDSTSNIWDSNPYRNNNKRISGLDKNVDVQTDAGEELVLSDGEEATFRYVITRENGTIEIEKRYTLCKNELRVDSSVTNNLTGGVITSLTPVYMNNDTLMNCLWPYKTGTLCKDGVIMGGSVQDDGSVVLQESYPTPISMQLVTLYSDDRTVSYTVEDTAAEYKTFFYKTTPEGQASVYCRMMPFVAPGESKTLPTVVITCFDTGDWTAASDHYREFLQSAGWVKEPGEAVSNFTGMNGYGMIHWLNDYKVQYVEGAPANVVNTMGSIMKKVQMRTGFDYLWITGWHDGGFDTYYPDYSFSEPLGGEAGFIQGVQEIHDVGGKTILYLNAHMSDVTSNWYNAPNAAGGTNGDVCSLKAVDGSVYYEEYPTSGSMKCVAMCPASEDFHKAILDAVVRVKKANVDALYLDQISEMRSYLCYDPQHGHSTPATAYYEGYQKLLTEISSLMADGGKDYFLMCEGVCDVYGKWIDVFCGYTDTNFLPYTRYTFPNKMIGRDLGTENVNNFFSSAFVLGEPLVCHAHHLDQPNSNLQRFIGIYKEYPDVFLKGQYVYHRGVDGDISDDVQIGVMEGENGDRSAVQVYSMSDKSGKKVVKFSYTPPVGSIVRAYDAETGKEYSVVDGCVTLKLESGQVISIIFEYK